MSHRKIHEGETNIARKSAKSENMEKKNVCVDRKLGKGCRKCRRM